MTDNSLFNKQQICPALVNTALQKLTNINPVYSNVTIDNDSEDLTGQSDPVLRKLLTNKNARESSSIDHTDSVDYIEGNDKLKENRSSLLHFFVHCCFMLMDQTYLLVTMLT